MNHPTALLRDASYSLVFHIAPRFANVLMFILVGRLAGPDDAGIFVLATTYLLIVTTIMRGMDDLIVRQVAREPQNALPYLTNFTVVRALMAVGLYGLLALIVLGIFDYAPETVLVIMIISLSVIPDSITYVAHSVMLGKSDFGPTAIVWTGTSLFKLGAGTIAVLTGNDLVQVAVIWLIGSFLGMMAMVGFLLIRSRKITRSDLNDWRPLNRNWQALPFFVLLTTLATVETQSDTIILSGFYGEEEVGWYGAATTVAYSLAMFSQAYRFAIFPRITQQAQHSPDGAWQLYDQSIRFLIILITPIVAGIIVLAPGIVDLIFGKEFGPTVQILQIIILAIFFVFLSEPNVRMMLAYDHQRRLTTFLLVSATLNVILNLILVPTFRANGSAIARVSSAMLYFLLIFLYITRQRGRTRLLRHLMKPLIATIIMVIPVYLSRDWSLAIPILIGALTYGLVLLIIGGITPDERRRIVVALNSRLRQQPPNEAES